jgi:probable DNA repair protein
MGGMDSQLAQALASGALVLTATRRLARWLRLRHDDAQRQSGRTAWESPRIAAFADWLREAWDEAVERPPVFAQPAAQPAAESAPGAAALLLSDAQAEALWEQVLLADPESGRVLHPRAAAALAQEAWTLSHAWQLPAFEGAGDSPDVGAYLRWSAAYRRRCDRQGWTDAARLPGRIAAAVGEGQVEVPAAVVLAGFDDLQPAYQAVVEALRSRGCAVSAWSAPPAGSAALVSPWPDGEAEAEAAARWARYWLEQGAAGPIGIVVPNLAERREQLERHLREVLHPGARYPQDPRAEVFNISQGVPLADVPLVRTALTALQLWHERIGLDVAGHLLRTPFLAQGESERSARGLLEARLRELGELEPRVGALQRLAAPGAASSGAAPPEPRPWHCPGLVAALARLRALRDTLPSKQSCGAWARAIDAGLAALGWPGERPLNSVEHQAREKWQTLLESLAHLERVLPPIPWSDAVARLARLAGQTPFQPETPAAPVQVLGLLESGGLAFAHLWVLGLDGDAWPPPARPHPFLPLALQRRLGLPRAAAARELEVARRHTERLRQAAPDVVFSHAERREDEDLRASPLLAGLPVTRDVPRSAVVRRAEQVQAGGALEAWQDDRAPALPEGAEVPGGTSVFRDMAACPFRAFALHRLHAQTLAEPVPGLGADRRGELAHRALEFLWRALGDHAALAALTPEAARALVAETVQTAIGACEERWHRQLPAAVAGLEQRRLTALLLELLELERSRAPFRVAAKEERRAVTLGGIALHVQIDRIDELPDGKRLLLDYKTGRGASVDAWFSGRPDEPQLPIYAVTSGQPVHAVGFVRVRHGDTGFVCITEGIEVPRRLATGSSRAARPQPAFAGFVEKDTGREFSGREEVLATWRATLDALGEQFRGGRAAVDPKDPTTTCTYCELSSLCRINPAANPRDGGPDADGGGGDAEPA